ncbi:MAG: hypothetical protein ACE5DU_01425 [Nitrosopumilus sp.]
MYDKSKLQEIIYEFVKNRTKQNETTASRHIHRRFDIPMVQAEEVLKNLTDKNKIEKIYDKEYDELRYQ